MFLLELLVLAVVAVAEFKLGQKYQQELQQEYLNFVESIPVTERIADHV